MQKGLLTRDQQPKEEEMKGMSEYISKLEGYADLEVSIIRATKINKVLKAILKLSEIPKESEFQFKDRSRSLLEKWNKILESAEQPAASATPAPVEEAASKELTNGVSTAPKAEDGDEKDGGNESKAEEPAAHTGADSAAQDAAAKEVPANESNLAEDSVVVRLLPNFLLPRLMLTISATRARTCCGLGRFSDVTSALQYLCPW